MHAKLILSITSFLFLSLFLNAADSKDINTLDISDKSISLALPIHAARPVGERLSLQVTLPKTFKPVINSNQDLYKPVIEFIPKSDPDVQNWSEIITTQTITGSMLSCQYILDTIAMQSKKVAKNVNVLELYTDTHDHYKVSTLVMTYTINNRNELLFARYFSGPYDCSGFQYSFHLTDSLSPEHALQKAKSFANNTDYITIKKS